MAETTAPPQSDTFAVIRTGSPRQTLQSLLDMRRETESTWHQYEQDRTHTNAFRVFAITPRLLEHFDLSQTPVALQREVGVKAAAALFDILGRVELPPMESVPEWDPFDESAPDTWRIPGTPIAISRINEGARAGEFLFSASTVVAAPRFYERIQHLPPKRPSPIESWTDELPHLTGPLFPPALVGAFPDLLKKSRLDTPIWKILASLVAQGSPPDPAVKKRNK